MRFDRLFHTAACALVTLGILAVTLAEQAYVYLLALVALVLIAWKREIEGRTPPLSRLANSLASLGALGFLAADYWIIGSEPLAAVAHFLLIIVVLKLYARKTSRDYFLLYVVCLIQLGLASLTLFQIDFLGLFLGYVIVGSGALVLFHLRAEYDRCRDVDPGFVVPDVPRRLAVAGVGLGLAVAVMTAVVFALLPRFGNSYQRFGGLGRRNISGLSNHIDFNAGGAIASSHRVVMRVKIEGRQPPSLLLRGMALDRYDGGRWRHTEPRSAVSRGRHLHPYFHNMFQVRRQTREKQLAPKVVQTVYLEPHGRGRRIVFAITDPYRVQILTGLSDPTLRRGPDQTLSHLGARGKQIVYKVWSIPPPADAGGLGGRVSRLPRIGSAGSDRYTQLPERGFPRKRFRALAEQLNRESSAVTDFDRVRAVVRYLRSTGGFRYDLDNDPGEGSEPLETFLFERRSGHCEYFAGSLAALLRVQGINCRVVNGYLGSEYNPVGDYWVIRDRNAHAWVEVYFHGAGWVPFDATPAAGAATRPGGWSGRLADMADYLRMMWITKVVSYDSYDQQGLYKGIAQQARDLAEQAGVSGKSGPKERAGGPKPSASRGGVAWAQIALFAGLSGVLLALFGRWRRRARAVRRRAPHPHAGPIRRLERLLRRRGLTRARGETARELAERAETAGVAGARAYVASYGAFRFTGRAPTPTESAELVARLAEISRRRRV